MDKTRGMEINGLRDHLLIARGTKSEQRDLRKLQTTRDHWWVAFASTNFDKSNRTATSKYLFPIEDGERPLKSIAPHVKDFAKLG
ncbi:hypothetical protein Tco_1015412 [Tanacetum coccineum]|uniref:Uncharacterized protein n=1 Tax=Tanacetum coccineum TaxID=301880 RepID=A0ABQ5FKU4_9ASTR